MQSGIYLADLSPDILYYLLSWLKPMELASMMMTNVFFNQLGQNNHLWKPMVKKTFSVC